MDGQRILSASLSSQAANKLLSKLIFDHTIKDMKRIGILSKNYIINVSCLLAVVTLSGILKYYVNVILNPELKELDS